MRGRDEANGYSGDSGDGLGAGDVSTDERMSQVIERSLPSTFRTSLSSWWATSKSSSVAAEDKILKRAGLDVRRVADFEEVVVLEKQRLAREAAGGCDNVFQKTTQEEKRHGVDTSQSAGRLAYVGPLTLAPGTSMNTLYIPPRIVDGNKIKALVITHGYGAGLGLYFESMAKTAEIDQGRWQTFYLDWPGMGRSARPHFPRNLTGPGSTVRSRVERAEDWFIDEKAGLEAWRRKIGLDSFVLAGHSMGGYLSAAYAIRYPERVEKLLLISPVGIPRDPNAPEPYQDSKDDTKKGPLLRTGPAPAASPGQHGQVDEEDIPLEATVAAEAGGQEEPQSESSPAPRTRTRRQKILQMLWEKNVSPFSVLRGAGPFGPMIVSRVSARKFARFDHEQRLELHDYLWNVLAAKGSGEFGITHLLAPGAFARLPLCDRMQSLRMPVSFVYGSSDWMDASGGLVACENMRKAGNEQVGTFIISGAGHQIFLENPFNGWVAWLTSQMGVTLQQRYKSEWYEVESADVPGSTASLPPNSKSSSQQPASVRLMNGRERKSRLRKPIDEAPAPA